MTKNKGLGAVLNTPDNRDISIARVQAPVALPKKYKTDISFLKRRDQKTKSSCVGQAGSSAVEFFEYLESGLLIDPSSRGLYTLCKARDGYADILGTTPRVLAKVLTDIGCPTVEMVPDDVSLSEKEYINVKETPELLSNAYPYRVDTNYAWVPTDKESLKQAIFQNKFVLASLMVGDDFAGGRMTPKPPRGLHYILIFGFEDKVNGDTSYDYLNSWGIKWGVNGEGYFNYSEMQGNIFDVLALLDIPNAILEDAKNTNFIFTETMKKGSDTIQVKELQKRLSKEIAIDGEPCYRYKIDSALYFSTYFGNNTESAVQRYQITNNIVMGGTPQTTGFGQVGPTTREFLNSKKKSSGESTELLPLVEQKKNMLISLMEILGNPIVVTDEYRSIEDQDKLYAIGRTTPGTVVTNAKGWDSFHNWRCAFDVAFKSGNGITYNGPWDTLGKIGVIVGLEWGGHWEGFIDRPHFQFTGGYTLDDFKKGRVQNEKFTVSSGIIEWSDYQIKDIFMISKRIKSFLISFSSILITALAGVIATPEFGGAVVDINNHLVGLGVPAYIIVIGGLLIGEVWKDLLNRIKIEKAISSTSLNSSSVSLDRLDLY